MDALKAEVQSEDQKRLLAAAAKLEAINAINRIAGEAGLALRIYCDAEHMIESLQNESLGRQVKEGLLAAVFPYPQMKQ